MARRAPGWPRSLWTSPPRVAYRRANPMKKYRCMVCDHVYDPAEGDPASGVAPGTRFEDLPADWVCPDCGALKQDFEPIED